MTIREKVTVLPGGSIQMHHPELPAGAEAEVIITIREQELARPEPENDVSTQPFWERIAAIGARIPLEEWDKVPRDLAKNFDHYHYGAPKEEGEE
ncbi:MAG TPA: hypothetical protein VF173_00135 [Thermoanaerobaculia bacterium]|nr:hypothetical protein [Thermoanaerobaculia bacterium]